MMDSSFSIQHLPNVLNVNLNPPLAIFADEFAEFAAELLRAGL